MGRDRILLDITAWLALLFLAFHYREQAGLSIPLAITVSNISVIIFTVFRRLLFDRS